MIISSTILLGFNLSLFAKNLFTPLKKGRAVSFFQSLLKSWGQGKEEFFFCLPLKLCLFSSLYGFYRNETALKMGAKKLTLVMKPDAHRIVVLNATQLPNSREFRHESVQPLQKIDRES